MTVIRFRSTEAGLRLLSPTLRTSLRIARVSPVLGGRVYQTSLGTSDPRDLALHTGFLRLVSIAEATVDSLGIEITERAVPAIDGVIRQLMIEKELAGTSSWDARRKSFKRHNGVDLRKCAEHARLQGAIEVRNAIAHGLGRLTTRQALSGDTPKNLEKVDVSLRNGYVDIEPRHLDDCRVYVTAFILSLDEKLYDQLA